MNIYVDRPTFIPPATKEQRALIEELGGHPPAYLSESQARTAIRVLKLRLAERAA